MNNFQKKKIFVVCIAQLSIQLEKLLNFPLKSSDWNVLKKFKELFWKYQLQNKISQGFFKTKIPKPWWMLSYLWSLCRQLIWCSEYFGERNFMYHGTRSSQYLSLMLGLGQTWIETFLFLPGWKVIKNNKPFQNP